MDVKTYVALSYSQDQWFCKANNCNWPFDFSDSFFESSFSSDTVQISTPAHNDSSVTPTLRHNDQLENQRNICNDILLCHLNINSIQNKFEELVALIRKLKIHIIFISKTKIDSTYPDSQFAIPGYTLYRNDRKKEVEASWFICPHYCLVEGLRLPGPIRQWNPSQLRLGLAHLK